MEIIGELFHYFETGTEGIIWSIQDEHSIDKETGYYYYSGLYSIKSGDILTIYDRDDQTKVLWEGEILLADEIFWMEKFGKELLPMDETGGLEVGFKNYPYHTTWGQLNFGGYWVHTIPVGSNLDLSLWYDVFITNSHKYKGKIVRQENQVNGIV